jgi:predicted dehydrogenase
MDIVRLGYVGAGGWARANHLPALRYQAEHPDGGPTLRIDALCEQQPELAQQVASEYGIPRVYASVAELAQDSELDAFAVVVNPARLRPILELLAPRGLPIFSEKPPGWSYAEALDLANLVPEPNLVAFNRRYFPIVQQALPLLATLDPLQYVHCTMCRHERHDSRNYRDSVPSAVPFVVGTAIHPLNLLEYLFGPIADCHTRPLSQTPDGPDGWLVDLTFASGLPGRLDVLPTCGTATERLVAYGAHRSLLLRYGVYNPIDAPGHIELHEQGQLLQRLDGDPDQPPVVAGGFVAEYRDFAHAVATGQPTRSSLAQSINCMRIAELIEPLPTR